MIKAKDLIKILEKYPEAKIKVGYDEMVCYGELTGCDDEYNDYDVEEVIIFDNSIILSSDLCFYGDPLFSSRKDK